MPWARVDDGWWCHPKVMGLTTSARGVWISALSWSCAQKQNLVPESLLRIIGGSNLEAKELVDADLWEPVEGGWCIHDWYDYQGKSLSEKRAEAGRKGGLASGRTRQTEATERSKPEAKAEAGSLPVPSRPIPTQGKPPSSPRSKQTGLVLAPSATPTRRTYSEGFCAFWNCYPRKVGKADAAKAYDAAVKKTSEPDLLAALSTHCAAWSAGGYEDQFIPHPATWLRQGRWDDDPPGPRSNGRESSTERGLNVLRRTAKRAGIEVQPAWK